MQRLSLLAVLLVSSPAAAEDFDEPPPPPPRPSSPSPVEHGYAGGGFSLTGDHFFNLALAIEGGLKLPAVPLWVRGEGELGGTGDFEGTGPFRRGRLGLEARTCSGPGLCAVGSFEVGYQTQVWKATDEMTEHHHGVIATGRIALDAGGENVRFRLGLEVSRYRHESDLADSSPRWIGGAGLTLGLVYRL